MSRQRARVIFLSVVIFGVGGISGWLLRGGNSGPRILEGWAVATQDGRQIACCSETPGGEARGYSLIPAWYDRGDAQHPGNETCLGEAGSTATKVRMAVVDNERDGKAFDRTVLWIECLGEPRALR